ncbi:discoidin domain-containing protein, partial [Candidatus Dependentiae bacterium]|nr:discoidin domain-containing protein [Candidatus Dependentiae bacterium]
EFSKVNFKDKDKWYAVRPGGQIVSFPVITESEEPVEISGSDRGVRSRATKKVQKKKVKSRSVRSARSGLEEVEEYKPVDVPATEGENYYFVGKDNLIYLFDRVNNEIRRVKEYDGELKSGNICLIFQGGKKVDVAIEELIPEEDEEKIASADDSKRGARSRTARSRQASKSKLKTKKKSVRSIKSVNPTTGQEEIVEIVSSGKTVTASVAPYSYSKPASVVDGSQYSSWNSGWKNVQNREEWVCIDLDRVRPLRKIRILWDSWDYPLDYKFQGSTDNQNWTDIASVTNQQRFSYNQYLEFTANIEARYVRALMTKMQNNWGGSYYIYEFEIYAAVSAQDKIKEVDDFITQIPSAADYEKIYTNVTTDTLMRFAALPFQMMSQMRANTPLTFDAIYKEYTKYPSNKIDPMILYETARERVDALKKMNVEDKDFSTIDKFSAIKELAKKTKLEKFTAAYNSLPEPEKLEGWHEQYIQQLGQLASLLMSEGLTEKDMPSNEKLMKCYEEFKTLRFAVKRAIYYIDMIIKQPLDPSNYSYESMYQSNINSMEYQINNAKKLGAKDADITNLAKFNEFKAGFARIPIAKFDNAVKELADNDPVVFNNYNDYNMAKSKLQYPIEDLYNTAKSKGAKDSDFAYFAKYKRYKDAVAAVETNLATVSSTILTYYNGDAGIAWKNKDKITELKKKADELTKMGFANYQTNADKINTLIEDIAQIDKKVTEIMDIFKKLPAPGTYIYMDTAQFENLWTMYWNAYNIKNRIGKVDIIRKELSPYGYNQYNSKYITVTTGLTEKDLPNMEHFNKLTEEYENYKKEIRKIEDEFNALLNGLEKAPFDEVDSQVTRIQHLNGFGTIYRMGANSMLKDQRNSNKLWDFVNKFNNIKNRLKEATALVNNLPEAKLVTLKDKNAIANARKKLNECGWPVNEIDKTLFAKLDACDEVIKNLEEGNNSVIAPLMEEYNKLYINTDMVRGEGWAWDAKIHFDIEEVRKLKAKFDDAVAKGFPIKADPSGKFYTAERLYSIFKPYLDKTIDALKAIPAPEEINTANFKTIANAENLMAEAKTKGWVDTQFIGIEKIEPAKAAGMKLKEAIKEVNDYLNNLVTINNNDWYDGKYGTYFEDCEKILPKIEQAKKMNAVDADFPLLWKFDRYNAFMSEKTSYIKKVNEILAAFPNAPAKDTVFDSKKNEELLKAYNAALNKGAKYSNYSDPQKTEKWIEAIKAFNEKITRLDNAFATLAMPDAALTQEIKDNYDKVKADYEQLLKSGASDTDFKHLSNFRDLAEPIKFYNEYVASMPKAEYIIRPSEYILNIGEKERTIKSKNKAYTLKIWAQDENVFHNTNAIVYMSILNSMNEELWKYNFQDKGWHYVGFRLKKDGRAVGLSMMREPSKGTGYWDKKIYERYEAFNAGGIAYLQLTDSGSLVFFDKDGKELKKVFENKNPHIMSDEEFNALNLPKGQDILIDGQSFSQWGKEVITSKNGMYNVMMITTREEALGGGNFNYHHSLILADKDWDWVWTSDNFIGSKLTMRRDGRLMLSGSRDSRSINEKFIEPLGAYLQITDNGL